MAAAPFANSGQSSVSCTSLVQDLGSAIGKTCIVCERPASWKHVENRVS